MLRGDENKKSFAVIVAIILCFAVFGTAAGDIIYVDAGAGGSNDGTSWADACNYLQDALAFAQTGDEVWVAEGTYKPDEDTGHPSGTGDRTATFQLKNGVAIYGGFPFGGGAWEDRDPSGYTAILTGDIGVTGNNSDNSYHLVTASGTDETAVLDGFTITGGNANGSYPDPTCFGAGMYNCYGSPTVTYCMFSRNVARCYGGGMANDESSPTLTNCIFTENSAGSNGGGMYNLLHSSPSLTNCVFTQNSAGAYGGGMSSEHWSSPLLANCTFTGNTANGHGGGMWNYYFSAPTLTDCTFDANWAYRGGGMGNHLQARAALSNCTFSSNSANDGGGMYSDDYSSPMLNGCTFSDNSADNGGGMKNYWSDPKLTNCTLCGNVANASGGGMYNCHSSPMLTNCTFAGNSAIDGSALACDSEQQRYPSNVHITNCILWDGGDEIWNNDGSTITTTYSNVQDGWPGEGNIDADPLFVDAVDDDYHLLPSSPCIDTGTNTPVGGLPSTDIEGNPRPLDGDGDEVAVADMGAYEAIWPVLEVFIDIKPGSYPNAVNLGSHGLIPVAILSDEQFDATTVDPDTVELAGSGVAVRGKSNKYMAHEEDMNGDGLVDLVVQVATENLEESLQSGDVLLTGNLLEEFGGTAIEGWDEITIVPPE